MSESREEPRARIERLISEGRITQEAVEAAERLWEERLRYGITIPNGEIIVVTLRDLYHVIVDSRLWRKPERIEQILTGIFEIRPGRLGRRVALTQWQEADKTLPGKVVIDADNTLRSMHIIDDKGLRREMRKDELLWKL